MNQLDLCLDRKITFCCSSMRRDLLVEVSGRSMMKTGLKSDVCQVSVTCCTPGEDVDNALISHVSRFMIDRQELY